MAKATKIAWAHGTFNPWRGCTKVSEACKHCYAEGWAKRTGKDIWGPNAKREHASESYWKQPVKWNMEASATGADFRVFCSSLADVCEDRDDLLEPRARLMRLIEQTPALTWLLCTKRPENFMRFFGRRWGTNWPKNVWALTTAEDQEQADKRLPHLLEVPAVVRGVSYEPALGPVNFRPYLLRQVMGGKFDGALIQGIHWVITGGESGAGARRYDVAWAADVVKQCRDTGAAPFVKQLGAKPFWNGCTVQWPDAPPSTAASLNGENGWLVKLKSPKGDDMDEFPPELQVQEFPILG